MIIVNALFWGGAGGVLYRLRGWGYWDQNVLDGRLTWSIGTGLAYFALTGSWLSILAGFAVGWIGLLRSHGRWFKMKNPATDVPIMSLIGTYQSAWLALPVYFLQKESAMFLISTGPMMGLTYWIGSKLPRRMVNYDHIVYSECLCGFQIMGCVSLAIAIKNSLS